MSTGRPSVLVTNHCHDPRPSIHSPKATWDSLLSRFAYTHCSPSNRKPHNPVRIRIRASASSDSVRSRPSPSLSPVYPLRAQGAHLNKGPQPAGTKPRRDRQACLSPSQHRHPHNTSSSMSSTFRAFLPGCQIGPATQRTLYSSNLPAWIIKHQYKGASVLRRPHNSHLTPIQVLEYPSSLFRLSSG